jgi:hypothetical protein
MEVSGHLEEVAMRYIVTVAALILSYAPTAGYAQDDPGTHSCGKYLAAVHGHAPGTYNVIDRRQDGQQFADRHYVYLSWLGGFLSATNTWVMGEPNGIKTDAAAIDVWIRKYGVCKSRPSLCMMQRRSLYWISAKTT